MQVTLFGFLSSLCLVLTTPLLVASPLSPDLHGTGDDVRPETLELTIPDAHAEWLAQSVLLGSAEDREERGSGTITTPPKSWVHDAAGSRPWSAQDGRAAVKARHPGVRAELVGYSELEGDIEAARRGAKRSAAAQIQALIWWRQRDLAQRLPHIDLRRLAFDVAQPHVDDLAKDSFEQAIQRPYGTVYRVALLVRCDDRSLEAMTEKLKKKAHLELRAARVQRHAFHWKVGAAALLACIVLALYFFLESATQGYYTWRLRLLALAVIVSGATSLFA